MKILSSPRSEEEAALRFYSRDECEYDETRTKTQIGSPVHSEIAHGHNG